MVAKTQLTRGRKTRIMYIELKSGFGDSGPARIGRVSFSKTAARSCVGTAPGRS